jgi:superfamily II DNA/RNA helicase
MSDPVFEADIHELEDLGLPSKDERFTSLFSTTFSNTVQKLADHHLRKNYIFLAVGTLGGANRDITQIIEEVRQANKRDRLCELLEQNLSTRNNFIFENLFIFIFRI